MARILESEPFKTSSDDCGSGGCDSAASASGDYAAAGGYAAAAAASSPSCHACPCPSSSLT